MSLRHIERSADTNPLQGFARAHVPTYNDVETAVDNYHQYAATTFGRSFSPQQKADRLQEELKLAMVHEQDDTALKAIQERKRILREAGADDSLEMKELDSQEDLAQTRNSLSDQFLLFDISGHRDIRRK